MTGHASTGCRAIAAVLGSLTLAPLALAGGEPKNEPPFTRGTDPPRNVRAGLGESKNQLPFTRPVSAPPMARSHRSGSRGASAVGVSTVYFGTTSGSCTMTLTNAVDVADNSEGTGYLWSPKCS